MGWFIKVVKNFSFSGRARRKEYWMFMLFLMLAMLLLTYIDMALGTYSDKSEIGLFSGIFLFAILIQTIAVSVRRLHDTGRSGWWFLVNFIPFVGSIIGLVLMVFEGQQGDNPYGPDPKEI